MGSSFAMQGGSDGCWFSCVIARGGQRIKKHKMIANNLNNCSDIRYSKLLTAPTATRLVDTRIISPRGDSA
jgi:hypothetical protein